MKHVLRALPIVGAVILMSALPSAVAEEGPAASHHQGLTLNEKGPTNALVRIVREATDRFKDVEVAQKEGYGLLFGCVSGDERGAMGLHFVNLALVAYNRQHSGDMSGQMFAFFIIAVAAAEASVGLAIVLAFYRLRGSVFSDDGDSLKH